MYHNKLQGFLYNLIRNSKYSHLHDRKGYKFFCFSNIFPPSDSRKGEIKNLIVSSPDKFLIRTMKEEIEKKEKIHIGEYMFSLEDISTIDAKLSSSVSIITGTPIVLRIPKSNYAKYGINEKYDYVFWKPKHSFEAFLKQLTENIYKKYNDFYKTSADEDPLLQQIEFKKPVVNHIVKNGREIKLFGSLWKFSFNYLNRKQQKILKFAIDCGFGELNSLGFGFMNVVK